MDALVIQDSFEPYYEGRKSGLAGVDPGAIDKAMEVRDRIDQERKVRHARTRSTPVIAPAESAAG
jgi:hypothetical protein